MKNPEELSESKRGLLERVLREEMARQTWEAPVHPRAPGTTVPLAPSQQQVWLHSQMGDPRFVYNEPITIHYHGPLDHSVFEHSFHEFLRRHEIWRTTNGKLDRNALPEPEAVESAGPYVAPASDIKRRLARIFESVLDVPRIGMRENFFDLGGHSLLVAKLLRRIELEFGKRLTMPTIFQSPTIEHLASLLGERNYLEAGAATVDIRPAGAHAPFFWIYGGPFFSSLASRLHLAHPFVSVALDPDDERAIGSSRTFPTLTQIAEPLVGKIRAAQPAGPYRLGGWCADGLIAYEVASQLVAAGEQVQLLAMVGTPNPVYYLSLPAWKIYASKLRHSLMKLERLRARLAWDYALERMKRFTALVRNPKVPTANFEGVVTAAALRYVPKPVDARIAVIRPSDRPEVPDLRTGWEQMLGDRLEIYDVEGDHVSMFFEAHAEGLAGCLNRCLDDRSIRAEPNGTERRAIAG